MTDPIDFEKEATKALQEICDCIHEPLRTKEVVHLVEWAESIAERVWDEAIRQSSVIPHKGTAYQGHYGKGPAAIETAILNLENPYSSKPEGGGKA